MFEHRSDPLLPKQAFAKRLILAFFLTIVIVVASLSLGTLGYFWLGHLPPDEAFHLTCLVLSGHDINHETTRTEERIFSGIFVLYARLAFVSLVAILLVPLLHRVLHVLHLDEASFKEDDEQTEK